VLPSDDDILLCIQQIYETSMDTHTNSEVKEVLLSDIQLRKRLLIVKKEITTIALDGHPRASTYLIRCSDADHVRTTGDPVDFVFCLL